MKNITLIAGSTRTRDTLIQQLKEYLNDDYKIHGIAIDEESMTEINSDLVILSSSFIENEMKEKGLLKDTSPTIVANRTINNDLVDEIVEIPPGTKVLFVNELPEIVYDVIDHLKDIGISHIDYVPYYPEMTTIDPTIKIAITPGEVALVPNFIEQIYNIGPRIMDFTTITKILSHLGVLDQKAGQFSQRYLAKTIHIAKRLADSKRKIIELNNHLEMVIDGLSDGLLVYNQEGTISVSNENFKQIIKSNSLLHVGRNIKDVLYNQELLQFLMDDEQIDEGLFKVNHTEYIISKLALGKEETIAKFRNAAETITESDRVKREMIKKGYFAKYTLDDIIGQSKEMETLKGKVAKLSKSQLTILIYGESGTGKELFASAIHNGSNRRSGPFLAVNFSALPDDLIESELFGYEDGAFTGAKKGGKLGLFEQAQGGTLFLDEIGDVSLKLQARLLRVLQEKEIMRVGGNAIIPIDVRIVAATNKNLDALVHEGKFREDLYHRLKMGTIAIPPLRKRKSDLPLLTQYLMNQLTTDHIIMDEDVIKRLNNYPWYGNVRELRNTLEYMVALSENQRITMADFPESEFFQENQTHQVFQDTNTYYSPETLFILNRIHYYNVNHISCGRDKLSQDTETTEFKMTNHQMRTRLQHLMEKGFIEMSKGKKGTLLTDKGLSVIGKR